MTKDETAKSSNLQEYDNKLYYLHQSIIITNNTIHAYLLHSKNCGVKITPPVLIEDHTMHFTPVLNWWC